MAFRSSGLPAAPGAGLERRGSGVGPRLDSERSLAGGGGLSDPPFRRREDRRLRDIKKVLARDSQSGQITVRDEGLRGTWSVKSHGGLLQLVRQGKLATFRHLDRIPPEVEIQPFQIPPGRALPPEKITAIQNEMTRRMQRDQEVRKDPAKAEQMRQVDADNIHWLEGVLQEAGWLDQERFGLKTSGSAVVLVKHSGVLPLMEAVLPYMEKDARGFGEVFAILYDAVKLQTGEKQRYGTQLGDDKDGKPMVLPLEDPASVDELRKKIGISPLAEYLKLAGEVLYEGKTIRMPREDE
jgi:hypothetical protein